MKKWFNALRFLKKSTIKTVRDRPDHQDYNLDPTALYTSRTALQGAAVWFVTEKFIMYNSMAGGDRELFGFAM
ncbi:MAG: hypothetical protein JJU13_01720 [Balneolaceae bacterium]|nr:hypothetical protein [Balneolaceae bacterium]